MAIIKNIITGHSFTCRNERVVEHCRKDIKTFVIEDEPASVAPAEDEPVEDTEAEEEPKPQKKTKTATKAVEIAAILYERDQADKHIKSESYSEGVVSENTTYLTGESFDTQVDKVLDSLKRYRRVYVKHKKKDSTEETE